VAFIDAMERVREKQTEGLVLEVPGRRLARGELGRVREDGDKLERKVEKGE
jgi:hypothetical protein